MNRSAQWVIERNQGEWVVLTEHAIRQSQYTLYRLDAYHYPMKRRALHFVLQSLEYLHKAYPHWQMRLRNIRDGDIIPMEAFGFGAHYEPMVGFAHGQAQAGQAQASFVMKVP